MMSPLGNAHLFIWKRVAESTKLFPTKLNKLKVKGLEYGFVTVNRPCEIFEQPTSKHDVHAYDMTFDVLLEIN